MRYYNEIKQNDEIKVTKEADDMNAILDERKGYRRLDMSKIKNRETGTMSLKESLKDIVPINWSDDVLNGKKKVVL